MLYLGLKNCSLKSTCRDARGCNLDQAIHEGCVVGVIGHLFFRCLKPIGLDRGPLMVRLSNSAGLVGA